jgi:hypothetical protein
MELEVAADVAVLYSGAYTLRTPDDYGAYAQAKHEE